jgi:hypothetical protein
LDDLAELPVEDLAIHLYEMSGHHLRDPFNNARRLKCVAQESISLDEHLALPVQPILDLTSQQFHFLEVQVEQVEFISGHQPASVVAGP